MASGGAQECWVPGAEFIYGAESQHSWGHHVPGPVKCSKLQFKIAFIWAIRSQLSESSCPGGRPWLGGQCEWLGSLILSTPQRRENMLLGALEGFLEAAFYSG